MAILTTVNQRNLPPSIHFCQISMTHSFYSPSSSIPHVTPPEFEPRPPAPEASTLTTRPWLTCLIRFPKKFIHDIPMVRVSRSIFKIIYLF